MLYFKFYEPMLDFMLNDLHSLLIINKSAKKYIVQTIVTGIFKTDYIVPLDILYEHLGESLYVCFSL